VGISANSLTLGCDCVGEIRYFDAVAHPPALLQRAPRPHDRRPRRAARFWRIANPSSLNRLGRPVSYRLVPGENVPPFAGPAASVSRRAGFMTGTCG
jgi:hypothetical protein